MSDEQEEAQGPEDLGGNATAKLSSFVERIECLLEEKGALLEDIKAVYSEAAGDGFDKKALKQIIKERAADLEKTIEHRAVVETYRRALGNLADTPLGDWARSFMSKQAKTRLDQAKQMYADPKLDEFLKGRKAKANDDDKGEARST